MIFRNVIITVGLVSLAAPATAVDLQVLRQCDLLAASPMDSSRPSDVTGVDIEALDAPAAVAACEAAVKEAPDDTRQHYQLGRSYQAAQNYVAAAQQYESAASGGSSLAANNLAVLYGRGLGVEKDARRALKWLDRAASSGLVMAMATLGNLYRIGTDGVPIDYAKAREWLTRAATAGNGSAMNNLGLIYQFGRGVEKSPAQAQAWFEKGATAGDA